MKLSICHLYPDVLNLYGDTGNILCLKKRLEWRGIGCEVTPLPIGAKADLARFDLFFIGGGQDFEQEVLLADLHGGKDRALRSAVEDEKVFLCICGGYQMMGQYYRTHTGEQLDFIGALDFHTVGSDLRMIGNYMFTCSEKNGASTVVGFENHSGKTFLGDGVSPLGKVVSGYGNNGEDGTEGARYKNVFGAYCHGPMLPKNPAFADLILQTALSRRYPGAALPQRDDSLERRAHDYMANRLARTN
ncbi:MAG: glutamine amidotransferase [Oscillospiraceae bacterium]|jgi:CobQ-like glutamine amidotransferase family enzyme|nr:glutamine amidotransferase [Oscillospiraceae bacterium]